MHIGLISKIVLVGAACLILAFVLPILNIKAADSLLTAAIFIFGSLYGFEISMVISNFSILKTELAIENAGLLSIHHLGNIVGGEAGQKIDEKLENYILKAIDYPLTQHIKTDKDYFAIFEPIAAMTEVKGFQKGLAVTYLNEASLYIPQSRSKVSAVAPRFVDPPVWVMLITLALFLVLILFIGRTDDLFSKFSVGIFATTIVGSLFLLDSIDSNQIQESYLEYGIFNETLETIGKIPYFPDFAIKQGIIKIPKNKAYRVGIFQHYPSLERTEIQTKES